MMLEIIHHNYTPHFSSYYDMIFIPSFMSSLKPYPRSKKQPAWLFQFRDLKTGLWKQKVLYCTKDQAYQYQRKVDADINYLKIHPEDLKSDTYRIDLKTAIKQFLKLKQADKAFETIKKYRNILTHFSDMLGPMYPVCDINNSIIDQFKLYYLNNHTPAGTNMALRHLKAFCYWCYDVEYLARRPKFNMLKTPKTDVRWLTKEQYSTLYELAPREVQDVMTICVSTGARIREILMCPWENIDLKDCVIILDARTVKGRFQSALYLNAKCINVLKQIKEDFPKRKCPFPYKYDYIRWRYRTVCLEAGIKSSTHDWRRSAGAWLLQEGVSIYHVSKFLRHSSTSVTEKHYADLIKDNYKDLSDQLEKFIN